jgi:regulator of sigma E protease
MSWVLTFLGIIALVILHELGHFTVAKAVGMRVEKFSLFFPPTLFSVRFGETEYAIGALPLGGYVKIAGMAPIERVPGRARPEAAGAGAAPPTGVGVTAASASVPSSSALRSPPPPPEPVADSGMFGDLQGEPDPDDPRGYFRQPVWKRMAVIAAGPAMNVLVAFLILWVVYATSAAQPVHSDHVRVASIVAHSPAAGVLQPGDTLVAVEGHPVSARGGAANFPKLIASHTCAGGQVDGCRASTPARLQIRRGSQLATVSVYPYYNAEEKRMLVGFSYAPSYAPYSLLGAAGAGASEMWHITSLTTSRIAHIFTSEHARKELHGIVGVSKVESEAFSLNVATAFFILALLSLSLAIINLFPFLPLDGGHLFWALAEKVRGRAIPFSVMERASMVGFVLVAFLFVLGLTNDISSLSNGSLTVHH